MAIQTQDVKDWHCPTYKQLSNKAKIADKSDEMPKDSKETNIENTYNITDRQFRFCQEFSTTGNATQAYKTVGYADTPSANANVHKLLRKDSVRQCIAEIQADSNVKTGITRELQAKRLDVIINEARLSGDRRTELKAIELQSKLHGLLIDRGINTDTTQDRELDQAEQAEAKRLAIVLMNERNKLSITGKQEGNKAG